MNEELKKKIANQIYQTLCGQRFYDWHADGGSFADHISGEINCKNKEEILKDIERLFNIGKLDLSSKAIRIEIED